MLLFFFPLPAVSVWWDFKDSEYKEREENSLKNPIFAVCTSNHCPHCRGIPQMLKQYSTMLGESSRVVFTNIVCSSTDLCNKIGVRGVPAFVLIRGSKPKYWVQTYERNMMGWNNFLSEQTKVEIREISPQFQLQNVIHQTHNGGTAFYLTYPESNQEHFQAFKNASSSYSVMGCSFSYKMEGSETMLYAYRSEECVISQKITSSDSIEKFIELNKYSAYHHYDASELYETIYNNRTILITGAEDPLDYSQRDTLKTLSLKYCQKIDFGWCDRNSDVSIMKFASRSSDDGPFCFIVNPLKRCFHISTGLISETDNEGTISKSLKGQNCLKIPGLRSGKRYHFTKTSAYIVAAVIVVFFGSYFMFQVFHDNPLKIE